MGEGCVTKILDRFRVEEPIVFMFPLLHQWVGSESES